MEDVQCIREGTVRGVSTLTEREVDFIKQHTATLGEDGEAAMSKIQEKARESGSQPADILRIIEDYCEDLGNRAMFRELSIDLEKGREAERKAQLEAMEAEVNKLKLINTQRDMASMMRGRKALSARLEEYFKGIEADKDKSVTSDPLEDGRRQLWISQETSYSRSAGMGGTWPTRRRMP
jgi:hypothetical protein